MSRLDVPAPTPEQMELCRQHADAKDAAKAERGRIAEGKERASRRRILANEIGPRHGSCSIETFEVWEDAAKKAVADEVLSLIVDIKATVAQGRPIIFVGPTGTGKDHLLAALLFAAVDSGAKVKWMPGYGVARWIKQNIPDPSVKPAKLPDVIAVSDPIPEAQLSHWEQPMFGELVDLCYRWRRSIWITCNLGEKKSDDEKLSGDESIRRYGSAAVSRLREDAYQFECNWESYRGRK